MPAAEAKVEIRRAAEVASNPVHALQGEIARASLIAERDAVPSVTSQQYVPLAGAKVEPSVRPTVSLGVGAAMRGHAESHDFDSGMIDALGPDPREAARQRIAAQVRSPVRQEGERKAKKKGGFNILGINIGGTSETPRVPAPRAPSIASNLRLPLESPLLGEPTEPRILPSASRVKARGDSAEELRPTLSSDDQLEIPAFLRRQAN